MLDGMGEESDFPRGAVDRGKVWGTAYSMVMSSLPSRRPASGPVSWVMMAV